MITYVHTYMHIELFDFVTETYYNAKGHLPPARMHRHRFIQVMLSDQLSQLLDLDAQNSGHNRQVRPWAIMLIPFFWQYAIF